MGSTGISDVAGAYFLNVRQLPRYATHIRQGEFATERCISLSEDD